MHRLALASLALCLIGCPPRGIDFGPKGEVRDADGLLSSIRAAEGRVVTIQGDAKLRVDSPHAKGVVSLFVAVSRPSLLHIESLDFFGRPQAVLVTDGKRFGLYQAEEGRYYRGPASAENVSRFLPVVLPPEELAALLLGQAPRIPAERQALAVDAERRAYRLVLSRGEVTQTLLVDPRRHRVLQSLVRGTSAYDASFDDFQDVGSLSFPRTVKLTAAAASTEIELRYKDVTLNATPDLTLFELTPPEGVPVVEVDARGNPRQAGGSSDGVEPR